jgi:hypothetical protein
MRGRASVNFLLITGDNCESFGGNHKIYNISQEFSPLSNRRRNLSEIKKNSRVLPLDEFKV